MTVSPTDAATIGKMAPIPVDKVWGNGGYEWAGMTVFSDVELVRMHRRFLRTKPVDDGKAALCRTVKGILLDI